MYTHHTKLLEIFRWVSRCPKASTLQCADWHGCSQHKELIWTHSNYKGFESTMNCSNENLHSSPRLLLFTEIYTLFTTFLSSNKLVKIMFAQMTISRRDILFFMIHCPDTWYRHGNANDNPVDVDVSNIQTKTYLLVYKSVCSERSFPYCCSSFIKLTRR